MQANHDAYEFTAFMDTYLKKHPEVVKDQKRGRHIHWAPKKAGAGELCSPRAAPRNKR